MFTPWGGSFSGLLREDQGAPVHRPSINLLRFASASDSCFLGESKLLGDREGLTFGGLSGIPLAPDHENIGSWRYQPTWDDCQQLLQTLLTTEERQRVLLEAKKNVLGANGQPTQLPNEIDACFPLVRPNWDFNAPEGRERLKMYRQALVAGLHGAARRPTNLAKVREVTQGPQESPTVFLERLMEAFRRFTPYDPTSEEHRATIAMAFIDQAAPDIKKKLQRLDGLQGFSLQELVKEADKVYNKRETEEEKEERKQKEQEAREIRRDKRQERNLSKILATVVGGRNIGDRNRQEGRTADRRRPLDKDQCAYCKEKGHWARECPKKKNGGRPTRNKILTLEEED
ncbi:uncharacterized protein [Pseudorca crassidens]|uniref:uncharacterized protein n=1 Tax=Pseudorca crassidens TaxID=82174 RepID=UPI00352E1F97